MYMCPAMWAMPSSAAAGRAARLAEAAISAHARTTSHRPSGALCDMAVSLALPSDKEHRIRYAPASSLERAHVPPNRAPSIIRREWFLGVSVVTALLFLFAGDSLYPDPAGHLRQVVIFVWLFAVIMGAALSVVRHAEDLAVHLGE